MDYPLRALRGLAWYRARRLTLGAVAGEMHISPTTLSGFIKGGVPGPRTLKRMQTWYEHARHEPEIPYRYSRGSIEHELTAKVIALDVVLEDFTDQVRGEARSLFLLQLLQLYRDHGMPRPEYLANLIAANREDFGPVFYF